MKRYLLSFFCCLSVFISYGQDMMSGIYQDSYIYAYIKPYLHKRVDGGPRLNFDPLVVRNISNMTVHVILIHNDELRDLSDNFIENTIREESFDLGPGGEYICNNYIGGRMRETHYLTTAYRIIQVTPYNVQSSVSTNHTPGRQQQPNNRPEPKLMTLPSTKRFVGYITMNNKKISVSFNLDFKNKKGSTTYKSTPLPLTISDIEVFPNCINFLLTETTPERVYIPNNKLGGSTTAIYQCTYYSNGILDGHGTNSKGQMFNFVMQ